METEGSLLFVHNSPPSVRTLSQLNAVYILSIELFMIHFTIILSST